MNKKIFTIVAVVALLLVGTISVAAATNGFVPSVTAKEAPEVAEAPVMVDKDGKETEVKLVVVKADAETAAEPEALDQTVPALQVTPLKAFLDEKIETGLTEEEDQFVVDLYDAMTEAGSIEKYVETLDEKAVTLPEKTELKDYKVSTLFNLTATDALSEMLDEDQKLEIKMEVPGIEKDTDVLVLIFEVDEENSTADEQKLLCTAMDATIDKDGCLNITIDRVGVMVILVK